MLYVALFGSILVVLGSPESSLDNLCIYAVKDPRFAATLSL